MGLEAINFYFSSEILIKSEIESNKDFEKYENNRYVYRKKNQYWIDTELLDLYSLSIRITLCNPEYEVLHGFHKLLTFLFSLKGALLKDLNTKEVYKNYNEKNRGELIESYNNRKKVFKELYGDYTAAIDSEEFYRRIRGHS